MSDFHESGRNFDGDVDVDGELSSGSISTDVLNTDHHYAGAYDGSDPDARLGNALSAASGGDVIHLERATYNADQTFSDGSGYLIVGTNAYASGSELDSGATWTFDAKSALKHMVVRGTIDVNDANMRISNIFLTGSITVGGDNAILNDILGNGGSVTFESGTSNGVIDTSKVSVTDNGANTVGDLG